MRILTWNVNGFRSVVRNGFFDWLSKESPDVLCLQETKCNPSQLDESHLAPFGYQTYWHSAKKLGYSGVAVFCKTNKTCTPKTVYEGIGISEIDDEGRVLVAEFEDFTLINAYFPNSQREHARLGFKLKFCKDMLKYCEKFKKAGRNIILCGDYNIAHKEIDLRNPKSNENNPGFLPQERAWMDEFLSNGYCDTFRNFIQEGGHYTWWSYRPGVRERNIGWRIDYHCVNERFLPAIEKSRILNSIYGSDHCPVELVLK